jgi:hypothetical protein
LRRESIDPEFGADGTPASAYAGARFATFGSSLSLPLPETRSEARVLGESAYDQKPSTWAASCPSCRGVGPGVALENAVLLEV